MKVSKIDKLGRIVIPIENRKELNLEYGSLVEITCEDEQVIIKPRVQKCKLCSKYIDKKIYFTGL